MEYVPGGSLADALDGTPWPVMQAARLVSTLARAIQAAHERGVVHPDLKPANILVRGGVVRGELEPARLTTHEIKVTDFGLAKHLDRERSGSGPRGPGSVRGTPSYRAPEKARGRGKEVGRSGDIYSLGGVLYELLTGRPPFKAANSLETLEQVRSQEPVPPR